MLRVRHETRYDYRGTASLAYELAWQTPLNDRQQNCLQHKIRIDPKPKYQTTKVDFFGNTVTYFEVHKPHHQLTVVSDAMVERVYRSREPLVAVSWESCRFEALTDARLRAQFTQFAYPSQQAPAHPEIAEYVAALAVPGKSILLLVSELTQAIYTDFKYCTGSTHIDTTVSEVWETREGVCQDFAHIAVTALRSLGMMTAYVSGYLLTHPAEGETKRVGADASHAWYAVFVPGYGWLHSDPTNNIWVEDEHITVALGRDYGDVPPLKGLCYGGGKRQPEVMVTVERISKEEVGYGY
ncbi:MAG: transglutaminase family protein [Hahellaceae bacterium]|nr:transglutaminase family protein [Hahellaceae bacterium]MCP5168904.1 transglutaminase family protein [Hahellaceae bacterium]